MQPVRRLRGTKEGTYYAVGDNKVFVPEEPYIQNGKLHHRDIYIEFAGFTDSPITQTVPSDRTALDEDARLALIRYFEEQQKIVSPTYPLELHI